MKDDFSKRNERVVFMKYMLTLFAWLLVPFALTLYSLIDDIGVYMGVLFAAISCALMLLTITCNNEHILSKERISKEKREQENREKFDSYFIEGLYRYHEAVNSLKYEKNGVKYLGRDVVVQLAKYDKMREQDDTEFARIANESRLETCLTHLYALCKIIKASSIPQNIRDEYMVMLEAELTEEEKYVCGKYRYIIYKLWNEKERVPNVIDRIIKYRPFGITITDSSDMKPAKELSTDAQGTIRNTPAESGFIFFRWIKKRLRMGDSVHYPTRREPDEQKARISEEHENIENGYVKKKSEVWEKCIAFIILVLVLLLGLFGIALSYPDEEYVKVSAMKGRVSVQTEYCKKSDKPAWWSWLRRFHNSTDGVYREPEPAVPHSHTIPAKGDSSIHRPIMQEIPCETSSL